jgi:DNA-binding GntR family transcriptional regulator
MEDLLQFDELTVARELSSLRHQATDRLRAAILAGRFAPGQRLVERELWQSLGISRPVLREALQHLQAEGLIRIIPHKGPLVATIDLDEARAIYEVRRSLEGLAGEGFARHASNEQVARLRAALQYLHTPAASADTAALLAAKNAFYAVLLEGCGNQVVGQILTQLNNRVTLLRRLSLSQAGRLPRALVELEAIVEAIEAHDPVRARDACALHVSSAAAAMMAAFPGGDTATGKSKRSARAKPTTRAPTARP